MKRLARHYRILFLEEPVPTSGEPQLEVFDGDAQDGDFRLLVPRLPEGCVGEAAEALQFAMLEAALAASRTRVDVLWYYTPMAMGFTQKLDRRLTVYDCMDELSAFRGAPPQMLEREQQLLDRADLVFTGGHSLYEAKCGRHPNVHAFPSSVDAAHFQQARAGGDDPADQADIPHPRLGYFGVVDERLDMELLEAVAARRPDWHLVLVGPVVKIDPNSLPRRANIHYLGSKPYAELPHYLRGWDVALMPFALNESTRFISPTKTPEYLAGGVPVVSTRITDVVRSYGDTGLVQIADDVEGFVAASQTAMQMRRDDVDFARRADAVLANMSWDRTCEQMHTLMQNAGREREGGSTRLPFVPGKRSGFDYLIVGAGFAGSVLAERLAAGMGKRVMIVDRRPHIGGNAYDEYDSHGLLVHRYGPHIFHTNAQRILNYLSRFTRWRPYEHRVLARAGDQLVPFPINLTTLNRLYGIPLDPVAAQAFLQDRAIPIREIRTSEDMVLSQVGQAMYETFFRGYTCKQWGVGPWELDKSVAARVPVRTSLDDRYFQDEFQQMPLQGYTRMFENMLDHPRIVRVLNVDFQELRREVRHRHLIYTGPIDAYFDYRYGPLPYRSLRFEHETYPAERYQDAAVINEPSIDVPYTRTTEFKVLTGQIHPMTSVCREYPTAEGDPYYPIPRPQNATLYQRYKALADATPDVHFVGRLATYRYYNMDQIVGQALALYQRLRALEGRTEEIIEPVRASA